MQDFVHLHVHTQYSLLDGQASVSRLVDKAMKDGMKGIAVTDRGNMFGIKEFTNYVNKKNSGPKGEIKDLKKRIAGIESGEIECEDKEAEIAACRAKITEAENKLFKPVIGCEMYVARRTMDKKEGKPDQSGYHLIVLAKNEKGYHNLIKLVSRAWTMGYYMRPRTDRNELEKYHEGLIVCSACIGGEVPKKIINDQLEEAEEAIRHAQHQIVALRQRDAGDGAPELPNPVLGTGRIKAVQRPRRDIDPPQHLFPVTPDRRFPDLRLGVLNDLDLHFRPHVS